MACSLRVCLLINSLDYGGAENLLVDLVEELNEVSFHVVYFSGDGPLASEIETAGATVHNLNEKFRFDPQAGFKLTKYLIRNQFDLIHVHLPYAQSVGRIAAKVAGVPAIVSTQHNVPSNYHPVTRLTERMTRTLNDATVAVSQGVEYAFTKNAHEPDDFSDHWCTIYNGINISEFRNSVEYADTENLRKSLGIGPHERIFLNVGRYVGAKSQKDLIRGFAVSGASNSHLIIVGHGPLKEELRQTARAVDVEERVNVTGRVDRVEPYYSLADVFVSSSRGEGMPITLIEAMAASLPVIATDIPGVREVVVDGESGYLYPHGNEEALASRIDKILTTNSLRQLGQKGFKRAKERFDIKRTAEAYLQLYQKVSQDTL